jgi:hypothetical protein
LRLHEWIPAFAGMTQNKKWLGSKSNIYDRTFIARD